jgi:hypothetical protein
MLLRDVELGDVEASPTSRPTGSAAHWGFTLLEERDLIFADRVLRTNHWVIDPRT